MSCCQREESIGSNRAETQVPNLVRVLIPGSARIERNVFSCSSANGVAELNAKSACAARPLAGSVWPAPNMRGVAERTVPYPRLLPAPAFVDPLWARQGGSARNSTEGAHGGFFFHDERRIILYYMIAGYINTLPALWITK
jgi:hypothetical protein